jgi:sterol desaturase/sphingolipid hydroxylase (fatty acid hydroxylase superfamily)
MREAAAIGRDFLAVFPHIATLEVGRYVITAALASVIIWAFWRAHYATRKIQARIARAKDYRREVLTSLRSALIFSMIGFGMYLGHKADWLTIYEDFSVRGPLYFTATLALMIVAQDAYFYWTHRLMHHPRLFRTFHWTHHKSKTPTPWTAYAFDAPEAVVQAAFVPLWAAVVPMHDLAIFTFVTWQVVRNIMGHAGVEMFPVSGKPSRLFGWFNSTTHHDLHHQDGRSNYGLYFSWWDRWMGTEHPEYQARVAEIADRARTAKRRSAIAAPGSLAVALFVLAALPGESRAQPASAITGNWATRGFGSIVQFRPCAASTGTMCGRIVWLWEPNDDAGRPRTDNHNPDRTLRTRPLIGVEIVRGLRETGPGVWSEGALYNPDDGRTYSGAFRLKNGVLELRGCAMSVFCQTQVWRRPEDVLAQVRGL